MRIFRLAVLGAAAYGIKKWLDENPTAKQQVRQAADTATAQAKSAAESLKHQVDERRHKDAATTDVGTPSMAGGTAVGNGAVSTPTTPETGGTSEWRG